MTDEEPTPIGTQNANNQQINGGKRGSVRPGFDSLRLIGSLTLIHSHSY
jgi:hypothetical protein